MEAVGQDVEEEAADELVVHRDLAFGEPSVIAEEGELLVGRGKPL